MIPSIHRDSKIIVDLVAIKQNIKKELARLTNRQEMFAVVKANGYGHGSIHVSKAAVEAGVSGFCVSNLDEAIELRNNGIQLPILILSYVAPEYVELMVDYDLSVTCPSLDWLIQVNRIIKQLDLAKPLAIHVKIDTGMGRIGFRSQEDMSQAMAIIDNNPDILLEGLFTHFATADSVSEEHFNLQKERFTVARALFPEKIRYVHTANSATTLWHDAWGSNMIRYGDAMYGLNPSGNELVEPFSLKQALSLETTLIHVKKIEKGEKVGYGATYETKTNEWIGTLPIGYADGLRRRFQGFEVLIDGQRVPIIGRVCMDQCMIKLPKSYPVGTKVTIFGTNQHQFNSIQSGADYIGTINYEITCGLSDRLPREFIDNTCGEMEG